MRRTRTADASGAIGAIAALVALAASPILLTGCSSPEEGPEARRIDLAEFSASSDPGAGAELGPARGSLDRQSTDAAGTNGDGGDRGDRVAPGSVTDPGSASASSAGSQASGSSSTAASATTAPTAPAGPAAPVALGAGSDQGLRPMALSAGTPPERRLGRPIVAGESLVVDSLVGQVNGQPIFADAFLEPIEDRLIAMATQLPLEQWDYEAGMLISAALREQVESAMYLAEAESDLSPQQRIGLVALMETMEEQIIAGHGGSREVARSAIREEGETFQERLESRRNRLLIRKLLSERITNRVIVSWRDIEREYERRYEEFNPPGSATIGRIRIATSDGTALADVQARLAAGEDFRTVAAEHAQPRDGEWMTLNVGPDGFDTSSITAQVLLDHLKELEHAGDVAGPFEVGGRTWWLGVLEENRPEGRDLYDPEVQRLLQQHIAQERFNEEQRRYVMMLFEEGIYDEMRAMADRLYRIARRRYAPN